MDKEAYIKFLEKIIMDKEAYIKILENIIENIIANSVKPLKNIPFNIVIKAISGKDVLKFDENNPEHKKVLELLIQVAEETGRRINKEGIIRTRANEVGNDIEKYVLDVFEELKINAQRPKGKSAGYPDIEFEFNGRIYYLECKTFNLKNLNSPFRTFYFSPSENFKVKYETIHFMLSYEVVKEKGFYKVKSYKIISLENLLVDLKPEFNSNNIRLYSNQHGAKILKEGKICTKL